MKTRIQKIPEKKVIRTHIHYDDPKDEPLILERLYLFLSNLERELKGSQEISERIRKA